MINRLGIALFWLLHWLPLPILARLGEGLGLILYLCIAHRRRIVAINLRLCFPELDETALKQLSRAHFRMLGRSLLERGLSWWASPERLKKLTQVSGEAYMQHYLSIKKPVILLVPHFIGLDIAGTRLALDFNFVSIYARQKNKVLDHWLYHGRSRFGDQLLLSRQEGIRSTIKALKSGRPFFYLPDMDYGATDAVFVPFFGTLAATITGLSRLSRITGAVVLPCVTRILPGGAGYKIEIGPPWETFATADVTADTAQMNQWLESVIRTMPEQYYWVHRRFKTRPPGEAKLY